MEKEYKKEQVEEDGGDSTNAEKQHQPPYISPMQPVTKEAYGGGMYAGDEKPPPSDKPPASATQSADGPAEAAVGQPKNKPPPSTGDRDLDITGQSYIQ